jgi:biopolymer transport protein ExbD
MTPMIDVVFQLLIYFLVTFTTPDILAELNVSRPPEQAKTRSAPAPKMIQITVFPGGQFEINGRRTGGQELRRMLGRLGGMSEEQTVLIRCAARSVHEHLVAVLDLCTENGLTRLSVVSME